MKTFKQILNESKTILDVYYLDLANLELICVIDRNTLVFFAEKLPKPKGFEIVDKIFKDSDYKIGKWIDDADKVDSIIEKNPQTSSNMWMNPKYFDKTSIEKLKKAGLMK